MFIKSFYLTLAFAILLTPGSIILAETKVTVDSSSGTKIVKHETSGNLEITHNLECQDITELDNENTPADLYAAVSKCFSQKNYQDAAKLFALAGAYGRFDQQRVADNTAHQAIDVLLIRTMELLTPEQTAEFQEVIKKNFMPEAAEFKTLCEEVREVGAPDYYPRYMIQHGMGAFGPAQENKGLVKDFDEDEAWEVALDTYIHCPRE